MSWNPLTLPDSSGRVIAVTGATAGIGYFAAEQLARAGVHVVLVSRSAEKLAAAASAIAEHVDTPSLSTVVLDLASLDSVARAADELSALPRLDAVLLNGGVMTMPRNASTTDGLPLVMGTHHFANAALAARLIPALVDTGASYGGARIVHTSTGFVRRITMRVDDLLDTPRAAILAYTQAKTATEVFAFELDRRLRAAALPLASIVVKPGVGVDAKTPERSGIRDASTPYQRNYLTPLAQGKDTAAWSAVRALLDPTLEGGDYIGPAGAFKGQPVHVEKIARTARPAGDIAARLWSQTEQLTKVRVPIQNATTCTGGAEAVTRLRAS